MGCGLCQEGEGEAASRVKGGGLAVFCGKSRQPESGGNQRPA